MSSDRDTTRIVRSWLDEGATALPDRVLDAVLDQIPATPQRRTFWLARRFPVMNNPVRIALAAAAVVVVAILVIRFLPGGNVGGDAEPTPTLSPTPMPSSTPTATAAPYSEPTTLAAGAYFMDPGVWPFISARFTFTVPDGWASRNGIIAKDRKGPGEVAFGPWTVANVYADPCHWQESLLDPPVGPTIEDLATALMDQVGRDASAPTDVVLGGYPAKRIEMSVPADLDFATCDKGYYRDWLQQGELHSQDPILDGDDPNLLKAVSGQLDVVYIVDVDGARVVLDTWHMPGSSAENLAELEAILASIKIEP